MKKPTYIEDLLKIIFFWIGIAFICAAILSYLGVLRPTANSQVQDPVIMGSVFLAIGAVSAAASAILGIITGKRKRLHSELLANGVRIQGTVEQVSVQRAVQYMNQSPYILRYVYTYRGKAYHRKSCLLWKKPDLAAGDRVMVYADDFGRSTVLP